MCFQFALELQVARLRLEVVINRQLLLLVSAIAVDIDPPQKMSTKPTLKWPQPH
jgi:hypothetical protein